MFSRTPTCTVRRARRTNVRELLCSVASGLGPSPFRYSFHNRSAGSGYTTLRVNCHVLPTVTGLQPSHLSRMRYLFSNCHLRDAFLPRSLAPSGRFPARSKALHRLANSYINPTRLTSMGSTCHRRPHSTNGRNENNHSKLNGSASHHDDQEHDHDHDHDHGHAHSIFGLHTHSHAGQSDDAEKIVQVLQGRGDRGSQITVLGLFSNIALTAAKGTAGWYMHSASLLAEAGHSLGDLVGDIVTLFCWRLSRKPPTDSYPYGFAKFETLGSTTVSLLLVGGALGIGFHSYHMLAEALSHTAESLPPGLAHDILYNVTAAAHHIPAIGHSHGHGGDLDPNAAWFAGVSVLVKEWLYRMTKRVADEEQSPVLHANALHHRSDAYTSGVVLCVILGSWWYPALPLDPIGGVLVSLLILRQSWEILMISFRDLTDAGVSQSTRKVLIRSLQPLLPSSPSAVANILDSRATNLLAVSYLRAKRTGSLLSVDLTADVPQTLNIAEATTLEGKIAETLKRARKDIAEVRVKFNPVDKS